MLDIQILPPDDESLVSDLQSRWKLLRDEIGLGDTAQRSFTDIQKHYTETHRMYHNLSHIHAMLKNCDTYISEIENHRVFKLAVWYHDIIYRSTRKDNELKSAEYALNVLPDSDLSPLELDRLKQLIISTKSHDVLLNSFDNHLLLDADLAILATSRETYIRYTHTIREEYKIYPDFLYKRGRKKVLQHFLERKQIYFTEAFKMQHEANARENLKWEIATLSK